MNSFFETKISRKLTWISPNKKAKNEINYIITAQKLIIQDIAVSNSLNIKSDHRIVRREVVVKECLERTLLHKQIARITVPVTRLPNRLRVGKTSHIIAKSKS